MFLPITEFQMIVWGTRLFTLFQVGILECVIILVALVKNCFRLKYNYYSKSVFKLISVLICFWVISFLINSNRIYGDS